MQQKDCRLLVLHATHGYGHTYLAFVSLMSPKGLVNLALDMQITEGYLAAQA